MQLGSHAEAEQTFRKLLEQAAYMHVGTLGAEVEHWLGVALASMGSLAEAREVEASSIAHAIAHGARWIEARARASLASILLASGDHEAAEREAETATRVSPDSPAVRAHVLSALAEIRLRRGAPEDARALSADALEVLSRVGGVEEGEALARLVHAEALEALGRRDEARAAIGEARDRLLERAAKVADETLRQSMLRRVPVHARTMALAETLA